MTSPYVDSELALSKVQSHASWRFFAKEYVIVPVGHFGSPKKLKNTFVHFVPFEDNAILHARVIDVFEDNTARVLVKIPYALRHVSLQHGGIFNPFFDKIHPRRSLIAKIRHKWLRLIGRPSQLPRHVARPDEELRRQEEEFDNDEYGREEITFLQAIQ
jgi:hypothetical protein